MSGSEPTPHAGDMRGEPRPAERGERKTLVPNTEAVSRMIGSWLHTTWEKYNVTAIIYVVQSYILSYLLINGLKEIGNRSVHGVGE